MNFDDIIGLVNRVVITDRGKPLSDVQRLVLKGSWENQTYGDIANVAVGYTEDYLKRDVGPRLWQLLSDVTGYTVNKRNIRNAMMQWAVHQDLPDAIAEPANGQSAIADLAGPPADAPAEWRTPSRLVRCSALRIDVSEFSGRQAELAQLSQWIEVEGCRLVLLWGLSALGKTTLAIKLAQQVQAQFDLCGYLELNPALSPQAFLSEVATWLVGPAGLPEGSWEEQLDWVLDQFGRRRCLLIVDRGEVLYEPHQLAGTYQETNQPYQRFLERVARFVHQSCLVWISQERPREFAALRGRLVQDLQLDPFSAVEARDFLMAQGWPAAEPEHWQALVDRYSGGPQLLKSLTPHLQTIHGGSLARFLEEDEIALPETEQYNLLALFGRLSSAERSLLYWLALAQEPLPLRELTSSMVTPPTAEVLQSLLSRALCYHLSADPTTGTQLDLNPAVRLLATKEAIRDLEAELVSGQLELLQHLPLLRVTAPEAVQLRQQMFVIAPLALAIESQYPNEAELSHWVQRLHQGVRSHFANQPGYAAGNVIHLCQALDISLSSFDFSNLCIWQANLQQVSLQGANLSQVRFQDTVFANALGRDLAVAFSQDGHNLAVGDHEGCLLYWEIQRGRLLRFLEDGNAKSVRSLAFSPQDDLLAVGCADGTIQLWLLGSPNESELLYGHQAPVQTLAFSPEGDILASGDQAGCLLLWDLSSGQPHQILAATGIPLRALQFSRQGDWLISCSGYQSATLWEVNTGQPITSFNVQATASIHAVGFMPRPAGLPAAPAVEMAFAAGYEDACLYLWDVERGQPSRIEPTGMALLPAVAVSQDGRFLAYSQRDRTVILWDIAHRRQHQRLAGFDLPVWSLAFSPDSRQLVTASDYAIKVWDVPTGNCLRSLGSHRYALRCFTFDGNSARLITGHDDTLLRSWQVATSGSFARRPRSLRGHTAAIRAVAAAAQGGWLASSSEDGTVRLWRAATRGESSPPADYRLTDHLMASVSVMAFSPEGRWLAGGGEDGLLRLWHLDADVPTQRSLEGHTGPITALAFSPNGQYVISGSRDRTLRLWHLGEGHCRQILQGHQRQVHSLSLSQDGQTLLSLSQDGTARWWQLPSGDCLGSWQHPQRFLLHGGLVDGEGRLVAIASDSDTCALERWSVTDSKRLQTLSGHSQPIWGVCISPDQRYLASASQDEEIRIWRLDLGTCEQVLRPDRPYEGVNIRGAKGLTEPEEQMLRSLGAMVSY